MLGRITAQYRRLRKQADWRALSDARPELEHAVVILGQSGGSGATRCRTQQYDVFVHGDLAASRTGLGQAQAWVHERYGELTWQRGRSEAMTFDHRYFGETAEFGSPTTYWYASIPA